MLGRSVPVSITSEFGKVDLNAADADTLSNLFEAAGEGPAEAAEEANQVINWRTGGTGTSNVRLFRTVSEVNQVPDITPDLYNRIASSVTVYSGRDRVDESTAPLLALEAMPGMDRLSAEAIINERKANQIGDSQMDEVANGQLAEGTDITGWAFTVATEFSLGECKEHGIAVIRMTGDPAKPYFVLWRDEVP